MNNVKWLTLIPDFWEYVRSNEDFESRYAWTQRIMGTFKKFIDCRLDIDDVEDPEQLAQEMCTG